jgi:hypothetical protein
MHPRPTSCAVVTRSSLFRVRQEMMRRAHRVSPTVELNTRNVRGRRNHRSARVREDITAATATHVEEGAGLRAGAGRRKAKRRAAWPAPARVRAPPAAAWGGVAAPPTRTERTRATPLQASLRMVGGTWDAASAGTRAKLASYSN